MNRSHERVLADIEQRVQADGVPPDEVDAAIANVLGVPADYYFAYLLVWGAIEAHSQSYDLTQSEWLDGATAHESVLDHAQSLAGAIGWLASTIYQSTGTLNGQGHGVADHAAKILGAVLRLRQTLRDLEEAPADAGGGSGSSVRA